MGNSVNNGLDDRGSILCKDMDISLHPGTQEPMGIAVLIIEEKMAGALKLHSPLTSFVVNNLSKYITSWRATSTQGSKKLFLNLQTTFP
jgi:hypothetical protein